MGLAAEDRTKIEDQVAFPLIAELERLIGALPLHLRGEAREIVLLSLVGHGVETSEAPARTIRRIDRIIVTAMTMRGLGEPIH